MPHWNNINNTATVRPRYSPDTHTEKEKKQKLISYIAHDVILCMASATLELKLAFLFYGLTDKYKCANFSWDISFYLRYH